MEKIYTQRDVEDLQLRSAESDYKFSHEDAGIAEWAADQDAERILLTGTGTYGQSMQQETQSVSCRIIEEVQEAAFRVLDHHLNTTKCAQSEDPSGRRELHAKATEEACLLIAERVDALQGLMGLTDRRHIESTTYWGATKALLRGQRKITEAKAD